MYIDWYGDFSLYSMEKSRYWNTNKKILQLIVCTITWICLFYHLVSIAHYVDESGEKIKNIMGNYGLGLLWVSIVSFSIYLFYLYIDFFFKKSN